MAQPTMSTVGDRLYDAVEPLAAPDEANGWPLAHYANGYGIMLDQVADLVGDQDDGTPGYAQLFDPDTAPAEWLSWLEYFAGITPYPAINEAGQRIRIKETDGRYRGTPKAIKGAARQHLLGARLVTVTPRTPDAYSYLVATYEAETAPSNLVTNPSFETNTTGWTAGVSAFLLAGATLTRVADTDAPAGDYVANVACNGSNVAEGIGFDVTLTKGVKYAITVQVTGISGNLHLELRVGEVFGSFGEYAVEAFVPTASFAEHKGLITPANTGSHRVFIRTDPAFAAAAGTFRVDAVQVVASEELVNYFDGDSPNATWLGTAHGSVSKLDLTELVQDALDEQKPAGFFYTHRVDAGWNIGQLEAAYSSQNIGNLESAYASIGGLENHLP